MSHAHDLTPSSFGRAFAVGIALNMTFVVIEGLFGWRASSLALLADAGHNLGDVGGLLLAWAALAADRLRPNDRHTYGWRRGSILASFANAMILLVAMGSLAWEAVQRLHSPAPVEGITVMVVAGVGVAVNGTTAALFMAGRKEDLNIRGAFLHMLADALTSMGVVFAGALYVWQGWTWIDPAVSLAIAAMIVLSTWPLLRQSVHLLFDGVPEHVDLTALRQSLLTLPGVRDVHDLHVWAMSTREVALTVHLVIPHGHPGDAFLRELDETLRDRFSITHPTIQVETNAIKHIDKV
ncbi:MAG: cation diffusion facilitator family transporter [Burkholderiales bacterium]|nr:cation diffusion facilitator family transporter [Burkholderiales bacterium]